MKKLWMLVAIALVMGIFGTAAWAQNGDEDVEGMNLQLFRPSIFGGDFIAIDDADTLDQLGFGFALYYDYANSLFSWFDSKGDTEAKFDLISELHTGHFSLAFGIMDWWSIGGHLPVHYMRYREFVDGFPITEIGEQIDESDVMLGDAMAKMKFRALRQDLHWIGMAIIPYATFATGDEEFLVGEGRITGGGTLALEHDFGFFDIALNGGYLYRQDKNELLGTEVGDAITYGAGISKTWDVGVGIGVEFWGRYYSIEDTDRLQNDPMEVTATLRYAFGKGGPRLVAGGGPGASQGVGAPVYRLLGGIDYYYYRPDQGMLIINTVDENGDLLTANLAIVDPADVEQQYATSGKWNKTVDAGSYNVAASREGYEPADAGAMVASGKDTVLTLVLKKIPEPKSVLNVTVVDKCTGQMLNATLNFDDGSKAEVIGGKLSKEMAPGTYSGAVVSEGYENGSFNFTVAKGETGGGNIPLYKSIEKTGEVYFATASHVILSKSFPVLDNVVAQIKQVCEFKMVTIEGHTDAQGGADYNKKLSQRRANSVKNYLISKGIDGSKLQVVAFGEDRPIASNETVAGREQNRRVVFKIK